MNNKRCKAAAALVSREPKSAVRGGVSTEKIVGKKWTVRGFRKGQKIRQVEETQKVKEEGSTGGGERDAREQAVSRGGDKVRRLSAFWQGANPPADSEKSEPIIARGNRAGMGEERWPKGAPLPCRPYQLGAEVSLFSPLLILP